jgi:hypothetical protein
VTCESGVDATGRVNMDGTLSLNGDQAYFDGEYTGYGTTLVGFSSSAVFGGDMWYHGTLNVDQVGTVSLAGDATIFGTVSNFGLVNVTESADVTFSSSSDDTNITASVQVTNSGTWKNQGK